MQRTKWVCVRSSVATSSLSEVRNPSITPTNFAERNTRRPPGPAAGSAGGANICATSSVLLKRRSIERSTGSGSLFLSTKPATVYVTSAAKCLIVKVVLSPAPLPRTKAALGLSTANFCTTRSRKPSSLEVPSTHSSERICRMPGSVGGPSISVTTAALLVKGISSVLMPSCLYTASCDSNTAATNRRCSFSFAKLMQSCSSELVGNASKPKTSTAPMKRSRAASLSFAPPPLPPPAAAAS
mmetsp:Transcript_16481/g.42722  ORF Transcript_16481/g.42722 Transcript_16481/m.42722 type:complete len:241 (-) Transcript_16481:245-967(-)